jgi:hypothetical protein
VIVPDAGDVHENVSQIYELLLDVDVNRILAEPTDTAVHGGVGIVASNRTFVLYL